ncbi:MAG: Gfo/Idh/MocA family oxidoreductase [Fimbriimonadaceae bacterium]
MSKVRLGIVGTGGMGRAHIRNILKQQETTEIVSFCDIDPAQAAQANALLVEAGLSEVPNEPDFKKFVESGGIDCALIATPHVFHFEHADTLLRAGVDVLLEKPMVMNTAEALALIETQREAGRLLAVAFNGSLSPSVRKAAEMIKNRDLGRPLSVDALVWQDWKKFTGGQWRQDPAIAGGGFMFDTGAHLLNTVADLVGEPFVEVQASMSNEGTPVDIIVTATGRTASGLFVTIHGTGDVPGGGSRVHVMCEGGVILTGIWGERLKIKRDGWDDEFETVELPASQGQWEAFLKVRNGEMPNPCPPEVGLRMIQLWDAIKKSASNGGALEKI